MNILRRFFLALFCAGLGFTLLATAWAHVGVATIGNRNTVKSWLEESSFYDNAVDTILETANKEQSKEGEKDKIPVDNPEVQAIAKNAFSPAFLKLNVEKVLDGSYSWLEGKTPKPEFVVDISSAKQQLAEGLGKYASSRAADLPACTAEQTAAMSEDFDALSASCLPPGVSPEAVGETLTNDIMTNKEFLADTTFNGDDFKVDENGKKVNIGDSEFRRAQTAYKLASYGPYIFAVMALLMSVAVFFLSSTKRRGLRRVGIIFIVSGVILGLTYLSYNRGSAWLSNRAQDLSGETSAGRALAAGLVKVIGQDISGLLLWYAIGFTALGAAGVIFAALYKRKGKNLKQPLDPKPPIDDSPNVDPAKDKKPEPSKEGTPVPKKPKTPIKVQF